MEKPPEKEKESALSRHVSVPTCQRANVTLHRAAMEVIELIELIHHLDLGLVL